MKYIPSLLLLALLMLSCKSDKKNALVETDSEEVIEEVVELVETDFTISPVSHATMVLQWPDATIYVDPVGGGQTFEAYPDPDLIVITDIHGDHLNVETLESISTSKTKIIVPQAVADKLPATLDAQVDVLNNGDIKERFGFLVEAIPMYNLREEALKFHEKGRGNGYVIQKEGTRIYISGDTEDIPEMRALEDIDVAFVCMNLPYTMTVKSAASAVVDFMPKKVYPYHYRGTDGLSDVSLFRTWIKKSGKWNEIEIVQLDWYPNQ